MPPRGRKKNPAGKVSSEAKTSRRTRASITSETEENIKEVKKGVSSRTSRSRASKSSKEISVNHCNTQSRKSNEITRSRRTRASNVVSTRTKKTKRTVDSDASDFSGRCSPLSTSSSGDISGQNDELSVASNASKNSVNFSSGSEEEIKIVLERFKGCSPKKKIKIENGMCGSMSSNENEEHPSKAKTAKKGLPRKLKKEIKVENSDENVKMVPKTEVTYLTEEMRSFEDLSGIASEKCTPCLPKLDTTSEMKMENSALCDTSVVDVSSSSSRQKLKQDDDAKPGTSKIWNRGSLQELADSASSSESEWEEVEEHEEPSLDDYKPDIPKEGVEITLENPLFKKRYKRKKFDFDGFVRLQINRFKKDVQLALHKVHLLCLLGHGLYLNEILNSCEIQALTLSLLPEELASLTKNQNKVDIAIISKVVDWFRATFTIDTDLEQSKEPSKSSVQKKLVASFETQKAEDPSNHNVIFVAFARTLGFSVRLCYSLYPLTFKAKDLLKKPKNKNGERNSEDDDIHPSKKPKTDTKGTTASSSKSEGSEQGKSGSGKKTSCKRLFSSTVKGNPEKSAPRKKTKKLKKKGSKSQSAASQNRASRPRRSKQKKSYKISSDENEDYDDSDADANFVAGDESGADSDNDDGADSGASGESDSDSAPTIIVTAPEKKITSCEMNEKNCASPRKRNSISSNTESDKEKNRKILSSDSEESSSEGEAHGIKFWSEVYSKGDKRWISVETSAKLIDKPYEVEAMAKQPVSYVVVFDNKTHIKDVTKRYCSQFLTVTRKLQVDPEWWEETLEPFLPPNNKQNKEEDQQILENLCNRPLPTTMTEVKSHPLYVIKPHLLKYEAIYPPDAAPVGYLRGEPIYSRDCVVTLHNREKWIKEARVIREGEKPYKMVKSRPKWDKVNRRIIKTEELPLVEVYGFWQTQPYVPPTAHDGKVPRNEYGNVELFKPAMLPKGTVHLQIPGLNRIARKLDIDCAPALTGFDVHNLGIHPVFDGWIVCKEFKQTLLDAWEEEQENIRKREQEKREKRIYGNWKKLIKGVLIRERIRVKYALK